MQGSRAMAATFILCCTAASASAESDLLPVTDLPVCIRSTPHAPAKVIEGAKATATDIYAAAGVRVTWLPEDQPCGTHITIRIVEAAMKEAGAGAMGVAPRTDGRRGALAFVFYRRIEAFAEHHSTAVDRMLGHVVAHEIGHLLLAEPPGLSKGIMVARWDGRQVGDLHRGWVRFTRRQAEDLRNATRTRNAN